jgi:antitoxin ParD1/3/4
MQLQPHLQRFIDDQIRAGRFQSAEQVVELALTRLMEEEDLTDEDLREMELSRQEIERGETVDFDEFASRMRQKYGIS